MTGWPFGMAPNIASQPVALLAKVSAQYHEDEPIGFEGSNLTGGVELANPATSILHRRSR
jgi:hypothetical protein